MFGKEGLHLNSVGNARLYQNIKQVFTVARQKWVHRTGQLDPWRQLSIRSGNDGVWPAGVGPGRWVRSGETSLTLTDKSGEVWPAAGDGSVGRSTWSVGSRKLYLKILAICCLTGKFPHQRQKHKLKTKWGNSWRTVTSVTETWINTAKIHLLAELAVSGYKVFSKDTLHKAGGGVMPMSVRV